MRLKTLALGTVRQWHWVSSAICLVGMLGFAITGIALNHAASIPSTPQVYSLEVMVPDSLVEDLNALAEKPAGLPRALRQWLSREQALSLSQGRAEWSEDELYVALPRPGGDAWLSLDLYSGDLLYERTDRGWVAYFNDLHKGRDTGTAWSWFIDISAVVMLLFTLTGFWLILPQKKKRRKLLSACALGTAAMLAGYWTVLVP